MNTRQEMTRYFSSVVLSVIILLTTLDIDTAAARTSCLNNYDPWGYTWMPTADPTIWSISAFDQDSPNSHRILIARVAGSAIYYYWYDRNITFAFDWGKYFIYAVGVNSCGAQEGKYVFLKVLTFKR